MMPRRYGLPRQTPSDSSCLGCRGGDADLNKSLTSSISLLLAFAVNGQVFFFFFFSPSGEGEGGGDEGGVRRLALSEY